MIAEHIWMPNVPEVHKTAAAETLKRLVEKFAGCEGCDKILSHLVTTPGLIKSLVLISCGTDYSVCMQGSANRHDENNYNEGIWVDGMEESVGECEVEFSTHIDESNKSYLRSAKQQKINAAMGEHLQTPIRRKHGQNNEAALDALLAICDLTRKSNVMSSEPGKEERGDYSPTLVIPCQLSPIADDFFLQVEPNLKNLCDAMIDGDFCSSFAEKKFQGVHHRNNVVKKSFSNHRLQLVKIIVSCILRKPRDLLSSISVEHWNTVTALFIEYPHCNLYHIEFRALITELVKHCNTVPRMTDILELVLVDCQLLNHLMKTVALDYKTNRSNTSGHELLICGALRLKCQELSPSDRFVKMLHESTKWEAFSPILEAQLRKFSSCLWTKGNIRSIPTKDDDFDKQSKKEGIYLRDISSNLGTNTDMGIDLGSVLADSLGFEGVIQYDRMNMVTLRRKNRRNR